MKVEEAELSDGEDLITIIKVVMQIEGLFEFQGFKEDVHLVEPLLLTSSFMMEFGKVELHLFHSKRFTSRFTIDLFANCEDLDIKCVVYLFSRLPVVVLIRSSFFHLFYAFVVLLILSMITF